MSSSEPGGDYPPRRTPFLQQGYGDMLRSVVLIAVLVAFVYGCSQLLESDAEPRVDTVDYSSELRGAEDLADYEVLAPRGLPARWRATSADVEQSGDAVAWHLGFLNPDDQYVGLEQTNGEIDPQVAEVFAGRQASDTVSAGGRDWQVFTTPEDNALVNVDGPVTTVVNGSPDVEVLTEFADTLR